MEGHLYSSIAASGMAQQTNTYMTVFAAGVVYKVRRLVGGLGSLIFPPQILVIAQHECIVSNI